MAATDDFPYKKVIAEHADFIARFERLNAYRPRFIADGRIRKYLGRDFAYRPTGEPLVMALRDSDYLDYNLITDWYIEPVRLRAIRTEGKRTDANQEESVIDYWNRNKAEILEEAKHIVPVVDERAIMNEAREIVYRRKKEVGTFRPTVATGFAHFMRGVMQTRCDYVLDPCAGWGDRLVGFMAAHVLKYTFVDPNEHLAPLYPVMIRDFAPIAKKHAPTRPEFFGRHIQAPFEDVPRSELMADLPAGEGFDLVFTSPPYFDLELYDKKSPKQSTSRYQSFDRWYREFFIASFAKAASCLRVGGVLAIIITDVRQYKFTSRMPTDIINEARTKHDTALTFIGGIAYAEINSGDLRLPQPIWLWRRM